MHAVPAVLVPPPSRARPEDRGPARGAGAVLLVLVLAACGNDARVTGTAPAAPGREPRPPAAASVATATPAPSVGLSVAPSVAPARRAAEDGPATEATDVLRSWNRARAEAYAHRDPGALRRLYVDGSAAGQADVRILRSYLGRGLGVEGMRTQLLAVEVLDRSRRMFRLRVVERIVGAEAVDPRTGRRRALPRDTASELVIDLRRSGDGWQVLAVSR